MRLVIVSSYSLFLAILNLFLNHDQSRSPWHCSSTISATIIIDQYYEAVSLSIMINHCCCCFVGHWRCRQANSLSRPGAFWAAQTRCGACRWAQRRGWKLRNLRLLLIDGSWSKGPVLQQLDQPPQTYSHMIIVIYRYMWKILVQRMKPEAHIGGKVVSIWTLLRH